MKIAQIGNLQIIRATAAFLVVLDHTFATSYKDIIEPGTYDYIHTLFNNFGAIGVNVFFTLSGFLMVFTMNDKKTSSQFIIDRVIRIYPPYLIYSIPIIIYAMVSQNYDHRITNVVQFVQNLLLLPGFGSYSYTNANYPGWTLVYEMFFYFAFAFALLFTNNKKFLSISLFSFFVVLVVFSRFFFQAQPNAQLTDFDYLSKNLVLINFVTGCLIGAFMQKNTHLHIKIDFTFVALGLMIIPAFLVATSNSSPEFSALVYGVLPSAVILIAAMNLKESKSGLVVLIGNATYSIYLTHVTVLMVRGKIANILNLSDLYKITLLNLLFVVLSIIVGILAYWYVEKPVTSKIKRAFKRKNPEQNLTMTK